MLKQQNEGQHSPWRHTPLAKPFTEERFDKNATQDILQTAARLQQAEQDTLSQTEIEAMAVEMGIAPRHVRQAIALSGRTANSNRLRPIYLSRPQKLITAATVLVYTVYAACFAASSTGAYSRFEEILLLATVFVLPFVIPFVLGIYVAFKRVGAAAGGLLTFLMFLSVQVVMVYKHTGNLLTNGGFWYALMIACGAVVAGIAGAALRQWLKAPLSPGTHSPIDTSIRLPRSER